MNWLCVIILGIPVLYIFNGFRRGMVKMAVSFLSIVLTLAASFVFNPYIERTLKQETEIYESVQKKCEDYIIDTVEMKENGEVSEEEQKAVIQKLPLPKEMTEILFSNNVAGENGTVLMESFAGYLSERIADFIINVISLFLTFLVISIVMGIVGKVLGKIFSFPILSMINRIGGGVLGAAKGICIIWIFFLIISVFWDSVWAQNSYYLIKENAITGYLYDKNMFLYFLNEIMK